MQSPPCSSSYNACRIHNRQVEETWEEKAPMFHSFVRLKAETISSYATYSKGKKKKISFPKCASLLLICFHFLYYIYHICNFHQGKTNHSLTTFFQKC